MSTADHLLLIIHVGFSIFTLGPLTAATMSTPRYIRANNTVVLRYLALTTRIYGIGTLGVFLFGLFLAKGKFNQFWLAASMTLFVVALVMLLILERDQRKVLSALEGVISERATVEQGKKPTLDTEAEQSRIAAFSGIIALIWIVILILMIWH
jgi:heme exporter protein D